MPDFLVFASQALNAFASWLDARSPVPWPLMVLAILPLAAGAMHLWVWWLRGSSWPVLCRYPTTRRVPCQNRVRGEWHKCHLHKRAWRRLTDGHVVDPGLSAWQTIGADNRKVHRVVVGVGLLRHRSTSTGLLYAHGLARPPRAVLRAIPDWYRDVIATVGLLRVGAHAAVDCRWRSLSGHLHRGPRD
jgi:hypothetical protein